MLIVSVAYADDHASYVAYAEIVTRCQSIAHPAPFDTHGSYIQRQFRSKIPLTS